MRGKKLLAAAAAVVAGWVARAAWGVVPAIGASRSAIRPYAAASPHYRDNRFHNSDSGSSLPEGSQSGLTKAFLTRGGLGRPQRPVPLATLLAPTEAGDLAVTWLGHASVLLEIDGRRVLTDPVWSERVSPSDVVGPARLHPMPMTLSGLPDVDAVVISHDHYDHLDRATITALARTRDTTFVVPLGVGAHLRRWHVPGERIVELDWDESVDVAGLTLTCTEARHFSGRGLARDTTLWASWVIAGPRRTVFFGGDSGYTPRFADLGRRYGPFDVTLLPIGAYDARWPDIHMTPEEAVRTHVDVDGGLLVPIHWATFNLAFHPWGEPVDRLLDAARSVGVRVAVPMAGQRIDGLRPPETMYWWR
ncbi:MBL fold metallo-hydrolase [Prescottella subtropica]|uniref:MBL fold metallo-hydrolase n=1 Tax=Prescottella subtropica TaxID=2545757 RepID=UPI0010F77329|nr:MBL fold metallo-hydrolase [Prescottella subtropica]